MQVLENIDLSTIVFYKIGGATKYLLEINNAADIDEALHFIKDHKDLPVRVLSLGANLVIRDEEFKGISLWMKGDSSSFVVNESSITCFAGESVDDLIKFSFDTHLVGLEWAGGLPSSVGGAVRGNAGCFGSEIKDSVLSVDVIDIDNPEMGSKTFSHEESTFGYRDSFFKHNSNLVIVSATFQLKEATLQDIENAKATYNQNIEYRKKNHPLEYPSCGSVFKNIIDPSQVQQIISVWPDLKELSIGKWHGKVAVGYVINRLGFSGKRIGGAQVSEKHANYISNIDHAKAADVKALIQEISIVFEKTFGFRPEPEVVIEHS